MSQYIILLQIPRFREANERMSQRYMVFMRPSPERSGERVIQSRSSRWRGPGSLLCVLERLPLRDEFSYALNVIFRKRQSKKYLHDAGSGDKTKEEPLLGSHRIDPFRDSIVRKSPYHEENQHEMGPCKWRPVSRSGTGKGRPEGVASYSSDSCRQHSRVYSERSAEDSVAVWPFIRQGKEREKIQ